VNRRALIAAACLLAAPSLCGAPAVWGTPDTLRVALEPHGGATTAFVVLPAGRGTVSAIVVVHEWWGLNAQIRAMARRFGDLGYVVIVPDLYHGKVAGSAEEAHELARGLPEERALTDIQAAVAWLKGHPRVGKNRIGIVGFCMGGRLSQLAALATADLAACVMFYGRPETDPEKLATLRAPLLGHFGAADRGIGHDQVESLQAGLKKAGKTAFEVYEYPGAGHAFMNESGRGYHADAARLAWARTAGFFQKHLKGR
jgi:carboxymethylenebutenolidase